MHESIKTLKKISFLKKKKNIIVLEGIVKCLPQSLVLLNLGREDVQVKVSLLQSITS